MEPVRLGAHVTTTTGVAGGEGGGGGASGAVVGRPFLFVFGSKHAAFRIPEILALARLEGLASPQVRVVEEGVPMPVDDGRAPSWKQAFELVVRFRYRC